jgi:HSP20 family molecular chaperone IbpA
MAKKQATTLPVVRRNEGFFESFAHLQDKIRERAQAIFHSRDATAGDQLTDWLQAESEVLTSIALSFGEEDGSYVLRGELPGFEPNEINIHVDDHVLTVGGSHRTSKTKKTKSGETVQTSETNFFRRLSLPNDADAEHIAAKFDGKVLEVTLPKYRSAR